MIIKYPTGFYRDVLPSKASDSTSVTYLISNSLPPRSSLVFPKLPDALVGRKIDRGNRPIDPSVYGALAVTVTKSAPTNVLSGVKAIDLGEVIEFEDAATQIVTPMLVTFETEVRHDTNKYDLASIGIVEEKQANFIEEIKKGQAKVRQELNDCVKQRADTDIEIDKLNKQLAEAEKTRNASIFANEAIGGSEVLQEAIVELNKQVAAIKKNVEDQIKLANSLVEKADELRNKYLTLCKLVK
jgi:hypothetical protein